MKDIPPGSMSSMIVTNTPGSSPWSTAHFPPTVNRKKTKTLAWDRSPQRVWAIFDIDVTGADQVQVKTPTPMTTKEEILATLNVSKRTHGRLHSSEKHATVVFSVGVDASSGVALVIQKKPPPRQFCLPLLMARKQSFRNFLPWRSQAARSLRQAPISSFVVLILHPESDTPTRGGLPSSTVRDRQFGEVMSDTLEALGCSYFDRLMFMDGFWESLNLLSATQSAMRLTELPISEVLITSDLLDAGVAIA
ncbi:974_t:CDS:2, partial [Paraglomus brasilianum]